MSGEDGPGAAARERRREQLRQWGARAGAEPGPGERRARTVRFERAAEFLAACAGGDLDEARLMLRSAEPAPEPGAQPEPAGPPPARAVLDATNADGISALHQVSAAAAPALARAPPPRRRRRPSQPLLLPGHLLRPLRSRPALPSPWTPAAPAGADCSAIRPWSPPLRELRSPGTPRRPLLVSSVPLLLCHRMLPPLSATPFQAPPVPPLLAILFHPPVALGSPARQACIDENLEVVRFLVEQGATVNQADNEGWTPLHVAASCGHLDIARYLLSHGANIAAVNSDGDLALDLAEADAMEGLLRAEITRRGVDVEAAKRAEEELLLRDTQCWLNGGAMPEARHPRTGASALHVAAAKGYIEVMRLLLQAGYDPELRDWDGWTPLHAAAHWGVEDACRLLAEHGGGMDSLTHAGQRPCDLADEEVLSLLEELAQKQEDLRKDASQSRSPEAQGPSSSRHCRSSVCRLSSREKTSLQDLSKERRPEGAGGALVRNEDEGEEGPAGPPPAESRALNGVSSLPPTSRQSPVLPTEDPFPRRFGLQKTGSAGALGPSNQPGSKDTLGAGLQRSASSSGLERTPTQAREPCLARITPSLAQKMLEPPAPSYQMPVRDEESESQRKARSRLMRQNRRPTQGVTLTDLKEAEKVAGKATELDTSSRDLCRRPQVPGLEMSDGPSCREVLQVPDQGPPAAREPLRVGKDWRGPAEGEEVELTQGSTESSAPERGPCFRTPRDPNPTTEPQSEEHDGDFRKLYAELRVENQRLREALTETTLQLAQLKVELERATQRQERFAERPALLELERFERRALERKASELEEELKALSDLRADNQRLKDENAALIRVISKLSK
ncbi:protein phosphatase 1 regulatory subunit 12C isoform X2 [Sorex araneus]|uniref:protein phosphatase 1 regulatory subunit 12C isoform X2 n=1 Tax=Sorex araneus TaxID=42254 RepID=UPI0024339733|nr:protein phosphatase 1 regulatory subunit 12C isoform X2 [Sorex araneus]